MFLLVTGCWVAHQQVWEVQLSAPKSTCWQSLWYWHRSHQVYCHLLPGSASVEPLSATGWFVSAWLGHLTHLASPQKPAHLCNHSRLIPSQLESCHCAVHPRVDQSMGLPDDRLSDGWGGGGRLCTDGPSHLAPAESLEHCLFECGGPPFWHTVSSTLCHRAVVFLAESGSPVCRVL